MIFKLARIAVKIFLYREGCWGHEPALGSSSDDIDTDEVVVITVGRFWFKKALALGDSMWQFWSLTRWHYECVFRGRSFSSGCGWGELYQQIVVFL